jgi:hypothetical protein
MTGIVLPALAAKALLLRETQHVALRRMTCTHPRNTPVAAPCNQLAEQYRAQPLSLEVRAYQQRRFGSLVRYAVRARHPKYLDIAIAPIIPEDRGHSQPIFRIDARQLVEELRRDAAERAKEPQLQVRRRHPREVGFDSRAVTRLQLAQVDRATAKANSCGGIVVMHMNLCWAETHSPCFA